MSRYKSVIEIAENASIMSVVIKKPNTRHIDTFLSLRCAPDMLALEIFPNTKEITESMACFSAVRKALGAKSFSDPLRAVISVGDGRSPRTASLFAFLTRWTCYSVDPLLKSKTSWASVSRLRTVPKRIENCTSADIPVHGASVAVVMVHSHAPFADSLHTILNLGACVDIVVSMPCCVPDNWTRPPDVQYEDWGVWSPQRTIKIWRPPL